MEDDRPATMAGHLIRIVRDEQDSLSHCLEALEPLEALVLKSGITHSDDFIEDENVRIDMQGCCKGQADKHP